MTIEKTPAAKRLYYKEAEQVFQEYLAPRGLQDRPPGLEHRELLIEAIQIGMAAGHADVMKRLPKSLPFPVRVRGLGDKGMMDGAEHKGMMDGAEHKGMMDGAEEEWLGAGEKGDCGAYLDLGETQFFVPAEVETCRGLPFGRPFRAYVVFEPDVEQGPLPATAPAKVSQRRFVIARRFVDGDGERSPLEYQTGQLIIGCDRCRTTSHFVIVGVAFGDSPHEVTVVTHLPLGWTQRGADDLCPRCSQPAEPQQAGEPR